MRLRDTELKFYNEYYRADKFFSLVNAGNSKPTITDILVDMGVRLGEDPSFSWNVEVDYEEL